MAPQARTTSFVVVLAAPLAGLHNAAARTVTALDPNPTAVENKIPV